MSKKSICHDGSRAVCTDLQFFSALPKRGLLNKGAALRTGPPYNPPVYRQIPNWTSGMHSFG